MPVWEAYPSGYRAGEVAALRCAARAGECSAVIGLSGAGKSNLLGFLAYRARLRAEPRFSSWWIATACRKPSPARCSICWQRRWGAAPPG